MAQSVRLLGIALLLGPPIQAAPPDREPSHRTDLYGDPLPVGAVARLGSVRLRHPNLTDFALPADGKTVVTTGRDLVVRWWDRDTGREVRFVRLRVETDRPDLVVLSPDGARAAVLYDPEGSPSRVAVCDTATGRTLRSVRLTGEALGSAAFSPDGTALLVGSSRHPRVTLLNVGTGEQIARPLDKATSTGPELRLAFSADGRSVIASERSATGSLRVLAASDLSPRSGPSGPVRAAALSADGRRVAVVRHHDDPGAVVRLLDLADGREVGRMTTDVQDGGPYWLALTQDPATAACVGWDSGCLLDLAAGRVRFRLPGGLEQPRFSADGTVLAARQGPRVRLWDVRTGREQHVRPGVAIPAIRAASPDGRTVALGDEDGGIGLWDRTDGRPVRRLRPRSGPPAGGRLAFGPDGRAVIYCSQSGKLESWDVASWPGGRVVRLDGVDPDRSVGRFALSPDGRRVAELVRTDERDDLVRDDLRVWDAADGRLRRRTLIGTPSVLRFDWLPDGSAVELIGDEAGVRVDDASGRIAPVARTGLADCGSPDGRMAAASESEGLEVWEVSTGRRVITGNITNVPNPPLGVSVGRRAVLRSGRWWVKVFDLATGAERGQFDLPPIPGRRPSESPVTGLMVLPGDRYVLTTLNDGTALVWDLAALPSKPLAGRYGETDLVAWWDELGAADAALGYAAAWKMSEAPAGEVVRFVRARLRPAEAVDAEEVRQLVTTLDHSAFAVRERANRRLSALGPAVVPYLGMRPPGLSAEATERLGRLEQALANPFASDDVRRRVRALAVLEWLGTSDARRLVQELAAGASAHPQTVAARATLQRLRAAGWP